MPLHSLFATCPRGLEPVLVAELERVGATSVVSTGGGAAFEGDDAVCYRANLESRVATRILRRMAHVPYKREQDIYDAVHAIPWREWFDVRQSIRVDVNATRCPLKSLDFVTLRIKDAVCDRFREEIGARPDVDTREPDVRIAGYLDATHFTLYLDTSGEPLHRRGYRGRTGEAPLRENLAAGLIALSGWDGVEAFVDPMCGSGTILIEAAMIALDIAPGSRRTFGFERLNGFDAALWQRIRDAVIAREKPRRALPIFGADLFGDALKNARDTLDYAGFGEVVSLKQANVLELPPPAAGGVMMTNPPYGVRMGEDDGLAAFYPKLGDALKARWAGWRCFFFTADLRLAKLIGLKASRRTPLFNGTLECRLFEYRMISGSLRKPAA